MAAESQENKNMRDTIRGAMKERLGSKTEGVTFTPDGQVQIKFPANRANTDNVLSLLGALGLKGEDLNDDNLKRSNTGLHYTHSFTLTPEQQKTAIMAIEQQKKETTYLATALGVPKEQISISCSEGKITYNLAEELTTNYGGERPTADAENAKKAARLVKVGLVPNGSSTIKSIRQEDLRVCMEREANPQIIQQKIAGLQQHPVHQDVFCTPPASPPAHHPAVDHNPTAQLNSIRQSLETPKPPSKAQQAFKDMSDALEALVKNNNGTSKEYHDNAIAAKTHELVTKNSGLLEPLQCEIKNGTYDIKLPEKYSGRVFVPRIGDDNKPVAYDILVYKEGKPTHESIIHPDTIGKCRVNRDTITKVENVKSERETNLKKIRESRNQSQRRM